LTPGLRECYRRVLSGFLEFCRQRRADSSVALARDYVELARLEQAPGEEERLHGPRKAEVRWWIRERGGKASGHTKRASVAGGRGEFA
jgi:hypothetical protein